MKAAYLGPQGTYSHLAAQTMAGESELVPYRSFAEIFKAVQNGEVDSAVIPVENALQGGVSQCLDLLFEHPDLYISAEQSIAICHKIVAFDGAKDGDIRRVFSHEQALGQCKNYLCAHFGGAELVAVSSTAEGLCRMKEFGDACIVGGHADIGADKIVLCENAADGKENCTVFLEVKRGRPQAGKNKVFFVCGCKDRPGALLDILRVLDAYGLNMTKIESRPLKTHLGEYIFFIEFSGNLQGEREQKALQKLSETTVHFRILGSY